MITYLAPPEDLARQETVVDGDAYRHLFRARRLPVGTALRVVDGRGHARWAEVVRIDRREAVIEFGDDAPANEPAYRLELLAAALRPERASWLVEKATEIGVAAIRFLASERAPRRYGERSLERWRRVAAAAVEQCHRSLRPEISGVHSWEEVPELLSELDEIWCPDPEGETWAEPKETRGAVLIGPEGGWNAAESEELKRFGAMPVTLGQRVLRAETAAVAAASKLLLPS